MPQSAAHELETRPTEHPHIVHTPGICGGRARVKGSRISVRTIAELVRRGEPVEEISATYPQLSLAAIYDAISYYLDHREEIETEIEANRLEPALEAHDATLGNEGIIRFDGR